MFSLRLRILKSFMSNNSLKPVRINIKDKVIYNNLILRQKYKNWKTKLIKVIKRIKRYLHNKSNNNQKTNKLLTKLSYKFKKSDKKRQKPRTNWLPN